MAVVIAVCSCSAFVPFALTRRHALDTIAA
jgi:hypothetical protein